MCYPIWQVVESDFKPAHPNEHVYGAHTLVLAYKMHNTSQDGYNDVQE